MPATLGELARHIGAELHGPDDIVVQGVAALAAAGPGQLSFLVDARHRDELASTRASAVIVAPAQREHCPVAALVHAQPHLAFARAAQRLHPPPPVPPGIHPSAVVADAAQIDPSASIGPLSVVEAGAQIGPRVVIGARCVIGAGARIGADSRLHAAVTLYPDTRIGERCELHSGAVLGSDGFGLADAGGHWVKIPQVGYLTLGDDVEIGANCAIDRGALEATRIGDGVKLDNQVHVAHNVQIGAHTAIAGCVGIAGSTTIGAHCTIAGAVALNGHIAIADHVHIAGMSAVTRSLSEPGAYAATVPAMPYDQWRKNMARLRQLDAMARRLRALEARLGKATDD